MTGCEPKLWSNTCSMKLFMTTIQEFSIKIILKQHNQNQFHWFPRHETQSWSTLQSSKNKQIQCPANGQHSQSSSSHRWREKRQRRRALRNQVFTSQRFKPEKELLSNSDRKIGSQFLTWWALIGSTGATGTSTKCFEVDRVSATCVQTQYVSTFQTCRSTFPAKFAREHASNQRQITTFAKLRPGKTLLSVLLTILIIFTLSKTWQRISTWWKSGWSFSSLFTLLCFALRFPKSTLHASQ